MSKSNAISVRIKCHDFASHDVLNRQVFFVQDYKSIEGLPTIQNMKGEYVNLAFTTSRNGHDADFSSPLCAVVTVVKYNGMENDNAIIELTRVDRPREEQ